LPHHTYFQVEPVGIEPTSKIASITSSTRVVGLGPTTSYRGNGKPSPSTTCIIRCRKRSYSSPQLTAERAWNGSISREASSGEMLARSASTACELEFAFELFDPVRSSLSTRNITSTSCRNQFGPFVGPAPYSRWSAGPSFTISMATHQVPVCSYPTVVSLEDGPLDGRT
jgi:hypothetical protein